MKNNKYGKDLDIYFQKLNGLNNHLLSGFTCDKKYIQKYFREEALMDKHSTTYLFINKTEDVSDVVSVLSINCSGIFDESVQGQKNIIPAIEISNFATNEKYQEMSYSENWDDGTLSHQIFLCCIDFIKTIPCSYCAASAIILHSVPDAVKFYKQCGFKDFLEYMSEKEIKYLKGCVPMYLFI